MDNEGKTVTHPNQQPSQGGKSSFALQGSKAEGTRRSAQGE